MSDAQNTTLGPLCPALPKTAPFGKPASPPEDRSPRFAELNAAIAEADQKRATRKEKPAKPKKKRRQPPIPKSYRKAIIEMAREHREKFREMFRADPKLKHRGARLYRSLLLPKSKRRGRPPIPVVTKAIRLLKQLKAKHPDNPMPEIWARIYPKVIAGYLAMDKQQKQESQKLIRDRARKRMRSQRIR